MLQEYSISDLFSELPKPVLRHACSFEKTDRSRLAWPHRCDFYSITWFVSGDGCKVVDFTEHAIFSNRLFLTSPQQIQNSICHRNVRGYMLMFDKIVAAQLGVDFLSPYVDVPAGDIPLLELVIENILRKKPDSDIEIDLLYFYSLIADKIKAGSFDPGGMNALFRGFKELIFTDNLKIHSMDQYADLLHISLASLNDICQNVSGSSAKQFLLHFKIAEAKRLLIYSRLNVSDIAYRLGFEDASYFARIFKKKTTLTPSAFLEKYRK
jgi:AraC-like DNA-binding protein